MTQENLNRRNISALADAEKGLQLRLQNVENEVTDLKRLVTQLSLENQELKSKIHMFMAGAIGPTTVN
jgi:hypothetical protein